MKNGSAIVRSISGIEVTQRSIDEKCILDGSERLFQISSISFDVCARSPDGYLRALDLVLCDEDRPEAHLGKFLGNSTCQSFLASFDLPDPAIKVLDDEVYFHPEIARPFSMWLNIPLARMLRLAIGDPEPTLGDALIGAALISTLSPKLSIGLDSIKLSQFIYLIEAGDKQFLKIGFTRNPEKRLSTLQSGNPLNLCMVGLIKGDKQLESKLHDKFAKSRARGEWFVYSNAIVNEFKRLKKMEMIEMATVNYDN